MNSKNMGVIIFSSLLLSSCGLIEKFKTADSATDSTETTNTSTANIDQSVPSDDLFNTNTPTTETASNTGSDAPSNINTDHVVDPNNTELADLQNEFSSNNPQESIVKEVAPEPVKPVAAAAPKMKPTPIKVKEPIVDINPDLDEAKVFDNGKNSLTGEVKNYKIQKGETLMQIAFKIYGDISRWKDLKRMNGDKLSNNTSLRSKTSLKYEVPENEFVWNPEGKPYIIKNGETLGTISNSVYNTPKKWKTIWENNKPLIKNPNIIYAGFTLYYKDSEMANYVQPKAVQPKITNNKIIEEIKVEHALTEIEKLDSGTEEINDIRSAVVRAPSSEEEVIPDTTPTPIADESGEDTSED